MRNDPIVLAQLWELAADLQLGEPVVIDLLGDAPDAFRILLRSWAAGAFRVEPLALPVRGLWGEWVTETRAPVLLVVASSQAASQVADLLKPHVRIVVSGPRGLSCHQTPLRAPQEHAYRGATNVRVEGVSDFDLFDVALPVDVEVMAGARTHLGVRGVTGASGLPPGAWFEVAGPGQVRVRVDLEARSNGDLWRVTDVTGRRLAPVSVPAPGRPRTVAVILDRTCPDEGRWTEARRVSLDGWSAHEAHGYGPEPAETRPGPETFNADIREGLVRGLRSAGPEVRIDGWSVADTAADHLPDPPGVALPESPVMAAGIGGSPDAMFGAAAWSPGLDFWDPLDLALRDALDVLTADSSRPAAVLFVGNSPPTRPMQRSSPLAALAEHRGSHTTAREMTRVWHEQLERALRHDIPISYVFLRHQSASPKERNEFDNFQDRQTRLGMALTQCGLSVLDVPATGDGVARGVAMALTRLAGPPRARVLGRAP